MELSFDNIHTAEDLFNALAQIPKGIRERLPLSVVFEDGMEILEPPFEVEAFEVTETEGCIERGFRICTPESSDDGDSLYQVAN